MASPTPALSARLAALLMPLCVAACASRGLAPPMFVYGPYKDVKIAVDRSNHVISTMSSARAVPVVQLLKRGTTLSWAFAVGECGAETLGGLDAQKVADANVPAFERAGVDYIIATGGEGGLFTCGSDAGMEAFIARYASPRLVGIDFDIEAKQTPEIVDALVQRVVVAQRRHPNLRFSFTLPTLAASDGSRASLNAQGRSVLQAIRRHGLAQYTINLMAMDYGPPSAGNCVVTERACDMGRSALQAVENLHALHGVAHGQIELTAMVGVNDVAANDFTVADADVIARYARRQGLAGLHFWALDRDTPCAGPASGARPDCSGLQQVPVRGFSRAFEEGLR
jgi:chitinase